MNLRGPLLVVDDYKVMREIISSFARKLNFDPTVEAASGDEALTRMRGAYFGLIVCDANMKPMGGVELVPVMRRDPSLTSVPAAPSNAALRRSARNYHGLYKCKLCRCHSSGRVCCGGNYGLGMHALRRRLVRRCDVPGKEHGCGGNHRGDLAGTVGWDRLGGIRDQGVSALPRPQRMPRSPRPKPPSKRWAGAKGVSARRSMT